MFHTFVIISVSNETFSDHWVWIRYPLTALYFSLKKVVESKDKTTYCTNKGLFNIIKWFYFFVQPLFKASAETFVDFLEELQAKEYSSDIVWTLGGADSRLFNI